MSGDYCARIKSVDIDSPFYDVGIEPGMILHTAEGHMLTDYIDWLWWTTDDIIAVTGTDLDGDPFELELEREQGENWGIAFESPIFDKIRLCNNACLFCFMRMLPKGMRPSLYLRDDDYRLSYLQGNFVTLTNLSQTDIDRIIEYRLEPLHVSLHAVSPDVRLNLIGQAHQRALDALEQILDGGLTVHTQIVLCPGLNDGAELRKTLDYIESHLGILSVGIVPLGYTKFQNSFDHSFSVPESARAVIEMIRPYQKRALSCLGITRYQLSDEFFCNAYPDNIARNLPERDYYDDFSQYYDGIGMLRCFVDEWDELVAEKELPAVNARSVNGKTLVICGTAFADFLIPLLREQSLDDRIVIVGVENQFFGGNINVSGLLVGKDVRAVLTECITRYDKGIIDRVLLPASMFNQDGLTLDDMTLDQIMNDFHVSVKVAHYTPTVIREEIR